MIPLTSKLNTVRPKTQTSDVFFIMIITKIISINTEDLMK